jgi:hypothetical protein
LADTPLRVYLTRDCPWPVSLAYKEIGGQEWEIHAPTEADYAHVDALRRAGRLAWAR